jgi:hypothetical protein
VEQVLQVLQVLAERVDYQVPSVHREFRGLKDLLVDKELPVLQVLEVLPVPLVLLVLGLSSEVSGILALLTY